jgi:hypothetical protein
MRGSREISYHGVRQRIENQKRRGGLLGRRRRRREDNIKVNFKEVFLRVDWIYLAEARN